MTAPDFMLPILKHLGLQDIPVVDGTLEFSWETNTVVLSLRMIPHCYDKVPGKPPEYDFKKFKITEVPWDERSAADGRDDAQ